MQFNLIDLNFCSILVHARELENLRIHKIFSRKHEEIWRNHDGLKWKAGRNPDDFQWKDIKRSWRLSHLRWNVYENIGKSWRCSMKFNGNMTKNENVKLNYCRHMNKYEEIWRTMKKHEEAWRTHAVSNETRWNSMDNIK